MKPNDPIGNYSYPNAAYPAQPCPCCGRCPTCGNYKPNTFTYSGVTSGSCGLGNISTTTAKVPVTYT